MVRRFRFCLHNHITTATVVELPGSSADTMTSTSSKTRDNVILHRYGQVFVSYNKEEQDDDDKQKSKERFLFNWPSGEFLLQCLQQKGGEAEEGKGCYQYNNNIKNDNNANKNLISSVTESEKGSTIDADTTSSLNESVSADDPRYWQASARWALLHKYGYLPQLEQGQEQGQEQERTRYPEYRPCQKEGFGRYGSRLELTNENIEEIQSVWESLVVQTRQHNHEENHTREEENGDDDDKNDKTVNEIVDCDERNDVDEDDDLIEFLRTVQSNNRILEWSIMDITSGCQFKLHAHPNIELVYCVYGELHEVRIVDGKGPITKTFHPIHDPIISSSSSTTASATAAEDDNTDDDDDEDDNDDGTHNPTKNTIQYKQNILVSGPSLSSILFYDEESDQNHDHQHHRRNNTRHRTWKFATLSRGQWLVNEVGSIHKSFTSTSGTGCILLCLWGGSHANINTDDTNITKSSVSSSSSSSSSYFNVDETVNAMDEKITTCNNCRNGDNGWERLEETFVPHSERK